MPAVILAHTLASRRSGRARQHPRPNAAGGGVHAWSAALAGGLCACVPDDVTEYVCDVVAVEVADSVAVEDSVVETDTLAVDDRVVVPDTTAEPCVTCVCVCDFSWLGLEGGRGFF